MSQNLIQARNRATLGGPDATASGFRRNKRSFLAALDHRQGYSNSGVDALDLLSLRDPDV
jgi:hypothetical protein